MLRAIGSHLGINGSNPQIISQRPRQQQPPSRVETTYFITSLTLPKMPTTTWANKSRRRLVPEQDSLRHRIPAHSSCYVPPIAWQPDILHHIDCDVLQPSADDGRRGSTLAVDDHRIADELHVLHGAPVRKSKDEVARRLFRLLIPTDLSFEVSRCVWNLRVVQF